MNPDIKQQIITLNDCLNERLNDTNFQLDPEEGFCLMDVDDIDDLVNGNAGISHEEITTLGLEEYGTCMIMDKHPEDDDEDAIDKYINCELILDVGTNNEHRGHVIKCLWGLNGEPIGRAHTNPLFDTRKYEIEFTDGSREKYMANIIAENIFAQVNNKGHQFQIIDEITDHHKDNSVVPISDGMIQNASGMAKPKKTTRGWELLMQFKDGSIDWVKLKDLKASNPIELAEYAVEN